MVSQIMCEKNEEHKKNWCVLKKNAKTSNAI
jgi:hypothetical protein